MTHNARVNKKNSGFTLIEVLMVVALVGITVGVTGDIIVSLVRSYAKTQVTTEIEQESNFLMLKLEKELKNADSVNLISSNELEFTNTTGTSTKTITYIIDSGTAQRNETDGVNSSSFLLTDPSRVNVTCGSFSCFEIITTSPTTVKIHMEFTQPTAVTATPFTGSIVLDNAVVVRGTY